MGNTICLQCFKDLRLIERAHRDHALYHPPEKKRHPLHQPGQPAPTITISYDDPSSDIIDDPLARPDSERSGKT